MTRSRMLLGWSLVALLALPGLAHAFGDEIVVGFMVPLTKRGPATGCRAVPPPKWRWKRSMPAGGVGGRKLTMVTKDTEGDNALAIQLARQLIDKDQVLAAHGPQWSAEAEAVFPICERSKILCFSPTSTKPGVSAPYMWAFRNTVDRERPRPSDPQVGQGELSLGEEGRDHDGHQGRLLEEPRA